MWSNNTIKYFPSELKKIYSITIPSQLPPKVAVATREKVVGEFRQNKDLFANMPASGDGINCFAISFDPSFVVILVPNAY